MRQASSFDLLNGGELAEGMSNGSFLRSAEKNLDIAHDQGTNSAIRPCALPRTVRKMVSTISGAGLRGKLEHQAPFPLLIAPVTRLVFGASPAVQTRAKCRSPLASEDLGVLIIQRRFQEGFREIASSHYLEATSGKPFTSGHDDFPCGHHPCADCGCSDWRAGLCMGTHERGLERGRASTPADSVSA